MIWRVMSFDSQIVCGAHARTPDTHSLSLSLSLSLSHTHTHTHEEEEQSPIPAETWIRCALTNAKFIFIS